MATKRIRKVNPDYKRQYRSSRKRSRALSRHEETFALHCKTEGVSVQREYVFHPTRKWRFDFAIPAIKLGIEIDGAIWMPQTGHSSGAGITRDIEKINAAIGLGWSVLRFSGPMVQSAEAIDTVLRLIQERAKS